MMLEYKTLNPHLNIWWFDQRIEHTTSVAILGMMAADVEINPNLLPYDCCH